MVQRQNIRWKYVFFLLLRVGQRFFQFSQLLTFVNKIQELVKHFELSCRKVVVKYYISSTNANEREREFIGDNAGGS